MSVRTSYSTHRSRRRPGTVFGTGCLLLFALPFAAAGFMVLFFGLRPVLLSYEASGWETVPATFLSVEVQETTSSKGSPSKSLQGRYEYFVAGERYVGDTMSFYPSADNFSSFHDEKARALAPYVTTGDPYPIYVDPQDPHRSVVFPEVRWDSSGFMIIFGSVFAAVGVGIFCFGLFAGRASHKESQQAELHPDEPWLHRPDWAAREIRCSSRAGVIFFGFLALVWNGVSAMGPVAVVEELSKHNPNYMVLLVLLFNAIGIFLLWYFFVLLLRHRKFGVSTLILSKVPIILGEKLDASLRCSSALRDAAQELSVRIVCEEKLTVGSGKSRSTHTTKLAEEKATVRIPSGGSRRADTLTIPLSIQVPQAGRSTVRTGNPQVTWQLQCSAEIQGPNFEAIFEIPVYAPTQSQA